MQRSTLNSQHSTLNLILLIILCLLLPTGCKNSKSAIQPAYIIITADTHGWIVPCGCTANQSGGLLRRGTYLHDLANHAQVLYADAGGAPAGTSSYQQEKFIAILNAEHLMHAAAHNLGQTELALGPAALRLAAAQTNVPLLSTNTRAADGLPIAESIRIIPFAGKKVALLGVVSPPFSTPDILIDDPQTSLARAIAEHKNQFDLLIVLAYLPQDELEKLAANLPEADAIIGGPTGQSIVPYRIGSVLTGAATNKGKFVVKLTLASNNSPLTGQVDELGPTIADDPPQLANLHVFLSILQAKDFPAADTGFAPPLPAGVPANYQIAGSQSCIACHAAESASFQKTHHAVAWASLTNKGFAVDSYCQQCHTTGFGLPGGFQSRAQSPALVNVGCESCHGPSLAHVQNPHIRTPYAAMDQCIRCHDHENSPQFDRATYWAKIAHGPTTQISPPPH